VVICYKRDIRSMLPPLLSYPCRNWHQSSLARALLDQLAPTDLRLALARGCPGPDGLVWYPAGQFGAATFEALGVLRETAIGPAFAMARDDYARAAALAVAQRAPSVVGAIAARFGDPDRWLGYDVIDATRRFRANYQ
jgi:hypothetical protein